ncbi:MAG: cytochrome c [Rhodobacteraceae bacterium]|nr:cytochrome c [Paracoccaceae bacterium]
MRIGFLRIALALAILIVAGFWLTRPQTGDGDAFAGLSGDISRGGQVFLAGGCASCHMAKGATGAARLVLSGGQSFPSPFGTFTAPNISPDLVHGIGSWGAQDLLNAMHFGTSPEGRHYYPAFPFTSYNKITTQDVLDLYTYLMALPSTPQPSRPHGVGFPFNIRAGLGLWKALLLRQEWVLEGDHDPEFLRGRYLVEALGHCGECHTPRGILGGLIQGEWLSGAPNPDGRGSFPNITPAGLDWSEDELLEYFTSGFTPDFDMAGGHMARVVENLSALPESDRRAIIAYLRVVKPLP